MRLKPYFMAAMRKSLLFQDVMCLQVECIEIGFMVDILS